MFAVIKADHDNALDSGQPVKTQCGGTVKTMRKAYSLMARMRAQQPLGGSNAFSIERVAKI